MPRARRSKSQQPEPPIYTFRVRIRPSFYAPPDCLSIWREIEIAANQTLADLGYVIPYAFDFDDPHLWAFFLSGKPWDQATEYSMDPDPDPFGGALKVFNALDSADAIELMKSIGPTGEFTPLDPQLTARLNQALQGLNTPRGRSSRGPTGPFDARDVAIRDAPWPGKTGKKEFLYIFDFGDEWHFGVKLMRTNPTIEPGAQYPRVVAAAGEAPPQYPDAEDFDWDEVEIITPESEQEPGQHPE